MNQEPWGLPAIFLFLNLVNVSSEGRWKEHGVWWLKDADVSSGSTIIGCYFTLLNLPDLIYKLRLIPT